MQLTRRTASAVLTIAVTASLAAGPALVQPASAEGSYAARAAVTSDCANAQTAWALAKAAQASAHRAVVKARKALRKARHAHSATKIRKAKRHLKRAKHVYVARTHDERVQAARVGYVCSAPTSSAHATGTGMKLNLLAGATGAAGKVIDPTQLTALLEQLLPGVTSQLDAGQLTALLNGFNAGALSPDAATVLLGSVFSPDQLLALLGGSPDPTVVLALLENIIDELSGLSGVPVPSTLDTTALQGILGTVTGLLGGLLGGTAGGTGGGGTVCLPLIGCL